MIRIIERDWKLGLGGFDRLDAERKAELLGLMQAECDPTGEHERKANQTTGEKMNALHAALLGAGPPVSSGGAREALLARVREQASGSGE